MQSQQPHNADQTRLDEIFKALRERKDLLADDEIRNIVGKEHSASTQGVAGHQAGRALSFQRYFTRKVMIVSSVLASVFALTVIFLKQPETQQYEEVSNKQQHFEQNKTASTAAESSTAASHDIKPILSSASSPQNLRNVPQKLIENDIPLNTSGIHFLELTPFEAQRFGLFLNDTLLKSVSIQQGMSIQSAKDDKITKGSVLEINYTEKFTTVGISDEVPEDMRFTNTINAQPFLVTSSQQKDGIMQKRMTSPKLDSLAKNLTSAIALGFDVRKNKVNSGVTKKYWGGYVVLWYQNTPEVRSALPDRYRIPLERELAAAQKYSSLCEIPTREEREEVEQIIAGKPFLETWRSCSGALSVKSVSPNPAQNDVTTRFVLTAPRTVTAALHDIRGLHLETLQSGQNFQAGEHHLFLNLARHSAGMYLLVLTTTQGEQTVQRVLIEK